MNRFPTTQSTVTLLTIAAASPVHAAFVAECSSASPYGRFRLATGTGPAAAPPPGSNHGK